MALTNVFGVEVGTVRPHQYTAVYVKNKWEDDWEYIPYLSPLRLQTSTLTSVDEGSFEFQFGAILRNDASAWDTYGYLIQQGAFIAVDLVDYWGVGKLWIGVIQIEQGQTHGTSAWPQGVQTFTAYGLEHILDRTYVDEAYTEDGTIERRLVFNGANTLGLSGGIDDNGLGFEQGNMSAAQGVDGTYLFSSDAYVWSNYEIAEYLLLMAYAKTGIPFALSGQAWDVLSLMFDRHDVWGMSILDALRKVIPYQRGAVGMIWTDGGPGDTIYIDVASQLAEQIVISNSPAYPGDTGGSYSIAANPDQVIAEFEGVIDQTPTFTFSETHNYGSVRVAGAPIQSCATFGFDDATLEADWTFEQELTYHAAGGTDPEEKDKARRSNALRPVFQRFKVPADWDGYSLGEIALPEIAADGLLMNTDEYIGPWHRPGHTFMRQLPFAVDGSDQPERQKMFVIGQDADNAYFFLDRVDGADSPTAQITPGDRDMTVWVEGTLGHLAALNHATEIITGQDPVWDYNTILLTAMFDTDRQAAVRIAVAGQDGASFPAEKLIEMPDCQMWWVTPQTVIDIADGALVQHAGGFVRDDSWRLWNMAVFASIWYSQARATLRVECKGINLSYPLGSLVVAAEGDWHHVEVGTVVTQRTYDFYDDIPITVIQTGFDELQFDDLGGLLP